MIKQNTEQAGTSVLTPIQTITAESVRSCFEMEQALNHARPDAEDRGFLLPSTLEEFEVFQRTAIFWGIFRADVVSAYMIALPSGHPRLNALITQRERFQLISPEVLDSERLIWIAKIVVRREDSRKGYARCLYEELIRRNPQSDLITATLIEPLKNRAAASFHERMGFRYIGRFNGGDRGGLTGCVSQVIVRPGDGTTAID